MEDDPKLQRANELARQITFARARVTHIETPEFETYRKVLEDAVAEALVGTEVDDDGIERVTLLVQTLSAVGAFGLQMCANLMTEKAGALALDSLLQTIARRMEQEGKLN